MDKSQHVREVYRFLQKLYPNPVSFLNYNSPYQLMVAVILSAQTTDAQVNKVTPLLFRNYPGPKDLMVSNLDKVEIIIRSTGFYKVKARNIIGAAKKLVLDYNSAVPEDMDDLLTIPGVGRKSANVIRAHCYDKPAIIVDTHFSANLPANCDIRILLSFDNRATWVKFSALDTYAEHTGGLVNISTGNTLAEIVSWVAGVDLSAISSIDFAVYLEKSATASDEYTIDGTPWVSKIIFTIEVDPDIYRAYLDNTAYSFHGYGTGEVEKNLDDARNNQRVIFIDLHDWRVGA